MKIADIFPSLGMHLGKTDGRNATTTKSGPGRKHKQHHQKGGRRSMSNSRMQQIAQMAAMSAMMGGSQVDTVANVPLKSATRGG
jgi:hypothetical protein